MTDPSRIAVRSVWPMIENEAEIRARLGRVQVGSIADLIDAAEACIVGTVRASKVLFSPGASRACVAYRFNDTAGHDEYRAVPFAIDDETGEARIEPSNAILLVRVLEGIGMHRSVVGAKYLAHRGYPGSYAEACVEVGQRVYVIGGCKRELDPRAADRMYRDQPTSRLRFERRENVPLVIADSLTASP